MHGGLFVLHNLCNIRVVDLESILVAQSDFGGQTLFQNWSYPTPHRAMSGTVLPALSLHLPVELWFTIKILNIFGLIRV